LTWQQGMALAVVQDVPDDLLESFFHEPEGAPSMHYPW